MYDFDAERLARLDSLRAEGIPPYPTNFVVDHTSLDLRLAAESYPADADLSVAGDFTFAGRVMFKNEMGKAGFARLLDREGRFQVYVKKDEVGEAAFTAWKRVDLGDWLWVRGTLMRTRTGEPTLKATELRLATKCMSSLPDKFHGMNDPELRQRQRYLDLFVNSETRDTFRKRARIVSYIREYFWRKQYIEVETPMMHVIPGGATARPFVTHHNALDMDLYLRVAPELYLKRLVVGGMERVFEINRNFRNEGIDSTHNPEFTMLEFYQAWATWEDLIHMTEDLLHGLVLEVCEKEEIEYLDKKISFALPFARRAYGDLVAEALSVETAALRDYERLLAAYKLRFPHYKEEKLPKTVAQIWESTFDQAVEKNLINPTFVYGFPTEISPLARRNEADPDIADRFELFIAGREIANGFNELNDPVDQAARFEAQVRARASGDQEAMYFDADYIRALCYGLPPTAGEGMGIDRLAMLLTNSASIREVILFPTLRAEAG